MSMRVALLMSAIAISLAAGTSSMAPRAASAAAPEAGKEQYVCPPCGNECDEQVFEQPGSCPVCGMELVKKSSLTNVAILVFPGVQIIDFTGPYEVFGQAHFNVYTVGRSTEPITTAMGLKITPQYDFASCPEPDILVTPGGNVESITDDAKAVQWTRDTAQQARLVQSVCNGAFILAKAGLLDGLEATTFASLIDDLKEAAPKTKVVSDRRFVDNGKIITSAGLSSGIDGALHVVEKLRGRGRAQVIATNLEYNWDPESKYVRAALADRHLWKVYQMVRSFDAEVASYAGGTDHWQTRWILPDQAQAGEMFERINGKLKGQDTWSRLDSGSAGNGNHSEWKFTDENGANWNGSVSIQPAPGLAGRVELTIRVARTSASS